MFSNRIIQKFAGKINKIIINDELRYHSIVWLLDLIEEIDSDFITDEFIMEYDTSLARAYYKTEYFEYTEFEEDIYYNFQNQDYKIDNIYFDKVNEMLSQLA